MKKSPRLQNRRTPRWLFDYLNGLFGPFKLDAFASQDSHLCDEFYTRDDNAYVQPWSDVTFANPEFKDMESPLDTALRQAKFRGVRSIILAPVGCSQSWYRNLAIQGTIYLPDRRINYDLPDGTPTSGADRDTMIVAIGGEHANPRWKRGEFRVRRLPFDKSTPQTAA